MLVYRSVWTGHGKIGTFLINSMKKILKYIFIGVIVLFAIGGFSIYQNIYTTDIVKKEKITFEVKSGESVSEFASRLESDKTILKADLLKFYLKWKNLDTKIQ